MKRTSVLIISLIVLCTAAMRPGVERAFRRHQVVPDLIDAAPKRCLAVTYAGNLRANLGNELTPTQVKDMPTLRWYSDVNAFYTLFMVDPDVPSRANASMQVRHWLVMNIPGCELENGETISEYFGSGAERGSGLHRYIFLVYKQPNGKITHNETFTPNSSIGNRLEGTVRGFVAKYNLGDPEFGNFFQAQWDEYAQILRDRLGV